MELDNEKGSVHNAGHGIRTCRASRGRRRSTARRRFGDVYLAQKTRGILLGKFEGTFENGKPNDQLSI